LRLDGDSSNKTHFSYGLGAGASYYFTPRLSGELSGEVFQAVGRKYFENSNAKIGMLGLKIGAGLTLKF
jgi:opacity protein-like surface antigen